jgi:hypothetical protein
MSTLALMLIRFFGLALLLGSTIFVLSFLNLSTTPLAQTTGLS